MRSEPEQEIRFCPVGDDRVAYATVGSGPPLLLPSLWISQLELEWGFDEFRRFVTALARRRTVIRYDAIGTGLSDRVEPDLSVDGELRTIEAIADALELESLSLLGISRGGCTAAAFAARHPERVRSLALFGTFADGDEIAPAPLREALIAMVHAHWGAGSQLLADVWIPRADRAMRDRFAQLQSASASADYAAAMLDAIYRTDVRPLLPQVRAPALVLHRRDDRTMPFAQGELVASLLPQARLVALEGDLHPPWLGDTGAVLSTLGAFLDAEDPVAPAAEPAGEDDR